MLLWFTVIGQFIYLTSTIISVVRLWILNHQLLLIILIITPSILVYISFLFKWIIWRYSNKRRTYISTAASKMTTTTKTTTKTINTTMVKCNSISKGINRINVYSSSIVGEIHFTVVKLLRRIYRMISLFNGMNLQVRHIIAAILDESVSDDAVEDMLWIYLRWMDIYELETFHPIHKTISSMRGERIIFLLIQLGCDLNAQDNTGRTPLYVACSLKECKTHSNGECTDHPYEMECDVVNGIDHSQVCMIDLVRTLIEAGARVQCSDHMGSTPLHAVASTLNITVLHILLNHYPPCVNISDLEGNTPLHVALKNSNINNTTHDILTPITPLYTYKLVCVVRTLLYAGGDMCVENSIGERAVSLLPQSWKDSFLGGRKYGMNINMSIGPCLLLGGGSGVECRDALAARMFHDIYADFGLVMLGEDGNHRFDVHRLVLATVCTHDSPLFHAISSPSITTFHLPSGYSSTAVWEVVYLMYHAGLESPSSFVHAVSHEAQSLALYLKLRPPSIRINTFPEFHEYVGAIDFSDITFVVGEDKEEIPAHRLLLALFSDYFNTMFLSGMKEGRTRRIIIEDIRPSMFMHVVTYLYTRKLTVPLEDAAEALYYGTQFLAFSFVQAIQDLLKNSIVYPYHPSHHDHLCHLLSLSEEYHLPELKHAVTQYVLSTMHIDDDLHTVGVHLLKELLDITVHNTDALCLSKQNKKQKLKKTNYLHDFILEDM